jgi:sarcosine oxidase subunit delta
MQTFECPIIGWRPRSEFVNGGRAIALVLSEDLDAMRYRLNFGHGTPTVRREWWYHTPSSLWFIVERDTASDAVRSVELAEPFE